MRAIMRPLAVAVTASVSLAAFASDSAKEQARLRKITFNYAICVVRKHHEKASEAVLATASNTEINGRLSQIIDSDCLGKAAGRAVEMRFPNDTYRYALADALVNADFVSHGDPLFANRLPLAQPAAISEEKQTELLAKVKTDRQRKGMREEFGKQNAFAWLARYGECVVREDPVNARYWLLTPPETPEETSRIRAMQPAFGVCLHEGTMHFNRVTARGTVAVNYYRLAMATVVSVVRSNS